MKNKLPVILVCSFVLLLAVGYTAWQLNASRPPLLATYSGTLPGADCAGLKTELALFKDNTYHLRETYLATRDGDKTFNSLGKWQKVKYGRRDAIQLQTGKKDEHTNYLVVDDRHLRLVDGRGKDIDCPFNLTLTRQ
jgi:copper homeostasis protein (lipoprotein)